MLFANLIFLLHINIEYLLLNIMEAERKKTDRRFNQMPAPILYSHHLRLIINRGRNRLPTPLAGVLPSLQTSK